MSNPLTKKVSLYKQLQYKISSMEGRKLFIYKKKKKRLTVGTYLGWHQWDFLRGKETFRALNVYLLWGSSKLGVYPLKQQQEPIHLFLPDCPCFFLACDTLKMAPVICCRRARRFAKTGWSICFSRKKKQNRRWLCWLRGYNTRCCILLFLVSVPQNIEIRLKGKLRKCG